MIGIAVAYCLSHLVLVGEYAQQLLPHKDSLLIVMSVYSISFMKELKGRYWGVTVLTDELRWICCPYLKLEI